MAVQVKRRDWKPSASLNVIPDNAAESNRRNLSLKDLVENATGPSAEDIDEQYQTVIPTRKGGVKFGDALVGSNQSSQGANFFTSAKTPADAEYYWQKYLDKWKKYNPNNEDAGTIATSDWDRYDFTGNQEMRNLLLANMLRSLDARVNKSKPSNSARIEDPSIRALLYALTKGEENLTPKDKIALDMVYPLRMGELGNVDWLEKFGTDNTPENRLTGFKVANFFGDSTDKDEQEKKLARGRKLIADLWTQKLIPHNMIQFDPDNTVAKDKLITGKDLQTLLNAILQNEKNYARYVNDKDLEKKSFNRQKNQTSKENNLDEVVRFQLRLPKAKALYPQLDRTKGDAAKTTLKQVMELIKQDEEMQMVWNRCMRETSNDPRAAGDLFFEKGIQPWLAEHGFTPYEGSGGSTSESEQIPIEEFEERIKQIESGIPELESAASEAKGTEKNSTEYDKKAVLVGQLFSALLKRVEDLSKDLYTAGVEDVSSQGGNNQILQLRKNLDDVKSRIESIASGIEETHGDKFADMSQRTVPKEPDEFEGTPDAKNPSVKDDVYKAINSFVAGELPSEGKVSGAEKRAAIKKAKDRFLSAPNFPAEMKEELKKKGTPSDERVKNIIGGISNGIFD